MLLRTITQTGFAISLMSTTALAGGFDRSGQDTNFLFEDGTYLELGAQWGDQTGSGITGTSDYALFQFSPFGFAGISQPVTHSTGEYASGTVAFRFDISEDVSLGFSLDQPYAADIRWTDDRPSVASLFQDRELDYDSRALSAIFSIDLNEEWSIQLGGTAEQMSFGYYVPTYQTFVPRYSVVLEETVKPRFIVGLTYQDLPSESRISIAYHSAIDDLFTAYELDSSGCGSVHCSNFVQTEASGYIPESINLDFTTALSEDWRLYGQVRWVNYSDMEIVPSTLTTSIPGYVSIPFFEEDIYTYMLGLEHQIDENLSVGFDVTYENQIENNFSWYNFATGRTRIGLSASYLVPDTQMEIRASVGYSMYDAGSQDLTLESLSGSLDVDLNSTINDFDAVDAGLTLAFRF